MLCVRSRYAFVGIYLYKLPVLTLFDVLRVIIDLSLVACILLIAVG